MSDAEFFKATGRHFAGNVLDISGKSGIIETSKDLAQEEQRYGRNKSTLINNSYINGGEYRRKFDQISDSNDVNRTMYQCTKKH